MIIGASWLLARGRATNGGTVLGDWTLPAGSRDAATGAGRPINGGSGDVTLTVPFFTLAQSPLPLGFGLSYHGEAPRYPAIFPASSISRASRRSPPSPGSEQHCHRRAHAHENQSAQKVDDPLRGRKARRLFAPPAPGPEILYGPPLLGSRGRSVSCRQAHVSPIWITCLILWLFY
jgi:hypothetical protein